MLRGLFSLLLALRVDAMHDAGQQFPNELCYHSHNVVLPRHYTDNFVSVHYNPLRAQYSLSDFSMRSDHPDCATAKELVDAVNNGWYVNATFYTRCGIPLHGALPENPCAVNFGDSLTRHMLMTVSMILSGNFVYGGSMRPKLGCMCDGQYSEHLECRSGILAPAVSRLGRCGPNAPPRLFFIQGGLHHRADAGRFFNYARSKLPIKLRPGDTIYFAGLHHQTPEADKMFPRQNATHARRFNHQLEAFAATVGGHFVDFMRATKLQLNFTSDGVHFLTSVNLLKARVYMALLHFHSGKAAAGSAAP